MSIFGLSWIFKKQNILEPDLTNPTEFINYARTFPEYQALCAVTDQESSDLSALSIYEMAVRSRAGIGATLPAANFKPELLADNIRNLLPLEMNIVARAKTDIDELLLDCFTNVGAALRSRADYIKQEHTYGAFAQESDFIKAAKYITSASNSISTAQAASQQTFIVNAMQNILNRDYDRRSLETLFHINSLFYDVNVNMPFRRPHRNVRYPEYQANA